MDVVALLLDLPVVVFTALVVPTLAYWLLVLVGAADVELLDGLAGGADGGADAVADAAADAAADGVADHAGDAALQIVGPGGWLDVLHVGKVPVTMLWSVFLLAAWGLAIVGKGLIEPVLPLPTLLADALVGVGATVGGLVATSAVGRPLARALHTENAATRRDYLGSTCTVLTGRVDGSFGQAEVPTGGAPLVIPVRCDRPNALRKGQPALVVHFDEAREAYIVEPVA